MLFINTTLTSPLPPPSSHPIVLQSKFQQVQIIKTVFGKTLVTDGKTQSAESDEKIYHESLVVPAMLKHGR